MKLLVTTLAILALGIAGATGGLTLTRQMNALAAEADAEKLNRAILEHVARRNPQAPIRAFQRFPEVLVAEAQRTNLDHCLALAQADVESQFRHDAVGRSGEIGIFQMLPSTAAALEPVVGPFRRPAMAKGSRDLGDLADPAVSTRYAMAYLREILSRKPNLRDAFTEYNGGPAGRLPNYYRAVTATYVETLEYPELRCRFRETPRLGPVLTAFWRV